MSEVRAYVRRVAPTCLCVQQENPLGPGWLAHLHAHTTANCICIFASFRLNYRYAECRPRRRSNQRCALAHARAGTRRSPGRVFCGSTPRNSLVTKFNSTAARPSPRRRDSAQLIFGAILAIESAPPFKWPPRNWPYLVLFGSVCGIQTNAHIYINKHPPTLA